jgi:flagellin-like protein
MKVWKNKKGVSPVIATILMVAITVVLAAVLYVMVMGMMSGPGTVSEPLGMYAKYVSWTNATVTINKAPANALLSGSSIVVINASKGGVPVQCTVDIYLPSGTGTPAYSGSGASISAGADAKWVAGITVTIKVPGGLSVGDEVQITGTGFSTSKATITS